MHQAVGLDDLADVDALLDRALQARGHGFGQALGAALDGAGDARAAHHDRATTQHVQGADPVEIAVGRTDLHQADRLARPLARQPGAQWNVLGRHRRVQPVQRGHQRIVGHGRGEQGRGRHGAFAARQRIERALRPVADRHDLVAHDQRRFHRRARAAGVAGCRVADRDPQALAHRPRHPVVATDVGGADIELQAARFHGVHAPAHALAGFEHQHLAVLHFQRHGGIEPGNARAHHDHVEVGLRHFPGAQRAQRRPQWHAGAKGGNRATCGEHLHELSSLHRLSPGRIVVGGGRHHGGVACSACWKRAWWRSITGWRRPASLRVWTSSTWVAPWPPGCQAGHAGSPAWLGSPLRAKLAQ